MQNKIHNDHSYTFTIFPRQNIQRVPSKQYLFLILMQTSIYAGKHELTCQASSFFTTSSNKMLEKVEPRFFSKFQSTFAFVKEPLSAHFSHSD